MIFVGIDIANCSATREEQNKRRQEEDKTRSQSPATEFRGAASQCVQGWSARPEDKRRTRGGQQQDKTRTRGGQNPATEFRCAASQCGQLFFLKIDPNSKLFGE